MVAGMQDVASQAMPATGGNSRQGKTTGGTSANTRGTAANVAKISRQPMSTGTNGGNTGVSISNRQGNAPGNRWGVGTGVVAGAGTGVGVGAAGAALSGGALVPVISPPASGVQVPMAPTAGSVEGSPSPARPPGVGGEGVSESEGTRDLGVPIKPAPTAVPTPVPTSTPRSKPGYPQSSVSPDAATPNRDGNRDTSPIANGTSVGVERIGM